MIIKALKKHLLYGLSVSTLLTGCFITSLTLPVYGSTDVLTATQLVRSFQRIQDQIVTGDNQALAMQKALYDKVSKDILSAAKQHKATQQDLRYVLMFVLSGGNPDILRAYRDDFAADPVLKALAARLFKIRGSNTADLLEGVDLSEIEGLLRAYIHLTVGIGLKNTPLQIEYLKSARLGVPGGLVEEAALRHLIIAYRESADVDNFKRVVKRYLRTFSNSPYARHVADEFVNGALLMDEKGQTEDILTILSFLPDRSRDATLEEIQRAALVQGRDALYDILTEQRALKAPMIIEQDEGMIAEIDQLVLQVFDKLGDVTREEAEALYQQLTSLSVKQISPENHKLYTLSLAALSALSGEKPFAKKEDDTKLEKKVADNEASNLTQNPEDEAFQSLIGDYRAKLQSTQTMLDKVE